MKTIIPKRAPGQVVIEGAGLDEKAVRAAFAADVRAGLSRPAGRRALYCRYFYDEAGSRLFDEICKLDEYYIPRAETEILRTRAREIAASVPADASVVELGSGSAVKTRIILEAFLASGGGRARYVPIDISKSALEESALALVAAYDGLAVHGVAGEYAEGLDWLAAEGGTHLVVWLGSNIGNFSRPGAADFLRKIRVRMKAHDRLLVGIDLRKDRHVLELAYNDAKGVTARFNLNLLERINRELGGDFRMGAFEHRARYDVDSGCMRIGVRSACAQRVKVAAANVELELAEGEEIHTEDSYKYSLTELDAVCREAGLRVERRWFDSGWRFCDVLLALP
jgi:dimethylhistidine N-methyltransferase